MHSDPSLSQQLQTASTAPEEMHFLAVITLLMVAMSVATALFKKIKSASGWAHDSDLKITIHRKPAMILAGAGPGDADLLTVAAVKAIKTADLVIADRLVASEILALVKGELRIAPPKKGGKMLAAQTQLNIWGLEALHEGKTVVRLKIGDPFVYGRGGEEASFFRGHGFPVKIIPGISSALCAPLAAGIPVTHRGVANEVLLTTGMLQDGALSSLPHFVPKRTIVVLMAVNRISQLEGEMLKSGYPGECPIAIVENANCQNQRVVTCQVKNLENTAWKSHIKSPAVIVIGEVVHQRHCPEP